MSISTEVRQDWIAGYKLACNQLSNAYSVLALLSKLTSHDCGQEFVLTDSEYDGLNSLFELLKVQIGGAYFDNLPAPHLFEKICERPAND